MKVFSIKKFVKDVEAIQPGLSKHSLKLGWPYELEGETYQEIGEMGFRTRPNWMKDKTKRKGNLKGVY